MASYDLVAVSADPSHNTVVDPRFAYIVSDEQMAQGSTIGAPRCCIVLKPTGALAKIFCPDAGFDFFGAMVVQHWDRTSRIRLGQHHGEFHIHPERQDHVFELDNGVMVHEQVFPYNRSSEHRESVPPPSVYYRVHFRNATDRAVSFDTYGFCELRGNTTQDIDAAFDAELGGIVAWNRTNPNHVRLFAMLSSPDGWETNEDRGKVLMRTSAGRLANAVVGLGTDPIGVLHAAIDLPPGEDRWVEYLFVLSAVSVDELRASRGQCPGGRAALQHTTDYYWDFLRCSVVRTPNRDVNQGVLWAKANILRVQTYAPTGWCFSNDPTQSNNSVGRDTAWMVVGADYLDPAFTRQSLDAYFRLQQSNGKIVEYYDVRNDRTEDYGLNVNDNTPLAVIALWHHCTVSGDLDYLRYRYPNAVRAIEYMLSQRNERGLVWCTSTKTANWGIVGWRNVIRNYRISGASTEVNSECYAALIALATMARTLGKTDDAQKYDEHAQALRTAINTQLVNPDNDLYYLTVDVDGTPRTDVTADLVFPVLFGVAPPDRAARIVSALSEAGFWTDAGIRTVPRDDLSYGPINGYGLLGGVWVAMTYWYAFAAAKHNAAFMAHALASSFRHFASDPRRNNTVPGQFSEWLHGEILVNQGMMLSPWDAPRYLWAAIEGAGGLNIYDPQPKINPSLAADWRWLTVVNVPFRGHSISWIACVMPEGLELFTTSQCGSNAKQTTFARDITAAVRVADPLATVVAFASDDRTLVFIGNSSRRTSTTAASLDALPQSEHAVRIFSTVWNAWEELGRVPKETIKAGIPITIDASGFALVEITLSS